MRMAYNEAIKAWEKDEVPIGAVVVQDGIIVAAAHNQVETLQDPTAHAEILAITAAAKKIGDWRLNQMHLYVTKEPCPMCAGACFLSRLESVVFAVGDPKMGGLGGAFTVSEAATLNHSLRITRGVFETECCHLLQAFFAEKRKSP